MVTQYDRRSRIEDRGSRIEDLLTRDPQFSIFDPRSASWRFTYRRAVVHSCGYEITKHSKPNGEAFMTKRVLNSFILSTFIFVAAQAQAPAPESKQVEIFGQRIH